MDTGVTIIFLVIAASTIVMTILVAILLYYILRIVIDIRKFTKKVKKEGEEIIEDVHNVRKTVEKPFVELAQMLGITNKKKKNAKKEK